MPSPTHSCPTRTRRAAERGGPVAGVVLAAGLGTRFGGAKLAAILEGRPLLVPVLETVRAALDEGMLAGAVVVLPAGEDAPPRSRELAALAEGLGLSVVDNDDPAAGLARSLRLALERLESDPSLGGALVFLGDQPRTNLAVVRTLVAAWRRRPSPILAPRYEAAHRAEAHALGNPVLLARSMWPAARRLRGDAGVRIIARRHPGLVVHLPVPGRNPDVDRPADLAALAAHQPIADGYPGVPTSSSAEASRPAASSSVAGE